MIAKMDGKIKKLSKSGFFHIFGSGTINKILTFANSLLIVRFVSKIDFGAYSYAQTIFSIACILNGIGIESALVQLCCEKRNESQREGIFYWGSLIAAISSLVVSLSILFVGLFVEQKMEGVDRYLLAMAILPILDLLKSLQLSKCRIYLENKKYSYISTIDSFLLVAFSITGAYFFDVYGVIIARYLSSVITIIVAFVLFRIKVFKKPEYSIVDNTKREIIKIGFIMAINNGMGSVLALAGTFILGLIIPDESLIASYKIASTIPSALLFIPQYLMIYFVPLFAKHQDDYKWTIKTYKSIMFYFIIFNVFLSVALIGLSSFFIPFVFGEEYEDAVEPFKVLMIAYFVQSSFRITSAQLLVTQRKLIINLVISFVAASLNILFNCLFIPNYASIGAAFSYLIAFCFAAVVLTSYWIIILYKKSKTIKEEVLV